MIQHLNMQYKENAAYNYWHEKLSDLNINKEQACNNIGNRAETELVTQTICILVLQKLEVVLIL